MSAQILDGKALADQIQEEIATVVASALQAILAGSANIPLGGRIMTEPEGYEAYLRGRYLLYSGSESAENLRRAEAEFLHALNLDPNLPTTITCRAQRKAPASSSTSPLWNRKLPPVERRKAPDAARTAQATDCRLNLSLHPKNRTMGTSTT